MEEYLKDQGFIFEEEKERIMISMRVHAAVLKVTLDPSFKLNHASYKSFRY